MADEEDYSSLPLLERVQHKVWKVRLGAYEEASKQFQTSPDENAPCFRPFLNDVGLWKRIVTDGNAAAQEAGVAALAAFLEFGGPNACVKTRSAVLPGLVEKGLASMRAGTKQKSVDCILLYVELDTAGPVVEELVPFVGHKLPKLVAATLAAMKEMVRLFGAKTVPPKPIVKVLPKAFGHADKNVRAEASGLALELYRWLGEGVKPILLEDLKPVQQKELEEQFSKVKDGSPQPERHLRSQMQDPGPSPGPVEAKEDKEEGVDAFDLSESVDVLGKLRKEHKEFDEMLVSTKWKERKEALDSLFAIANVRRIKNDDYSSLLAQMAKIVEKDANVMVVVTSANCIEVIAKGLRKDFQRYHHILPHLLERLKEKKQNVIDGIAAAADAIFASIAISDVVEDLIPFLGHKNPQCKVESIKFLTRAFSTTPTAPSKGETKLLAESLRKALNDTSAPVRDASADAFGVLMKIQGERAMAPYYEDIDDIRKGKIKESFQAATVRAKPFSAPAPGAGTGTGTGPAAEAKKPMAKKTVSTRVESRPATKPARPLSASSKPLSKPPLKRSLAASPTRRNDEPVEKPSSVRGLGRSLTSRPLPASAPLSRTGSGHPDREVETLRGENATLRQAADEQASKMAQLSTQVQELQLRNAQLAEAHTRDLLTLKTHESQLTRAKSEADATRAQLLRVQAELDHVRPDRPDRPDRGRARSFAQEEKENQAEKQAGEADDGESAADSWRRAAEVTDRLKAKIEQMKARNMERPV